MEPLVRHRIPAAVALAADAGHVLLSHTHGPVDDTTIFAIASMTKAITTLAALQLVDRGLLVLDAPALRDLPLLEGFSPSGQPRFSAERHSPTLRQLLTHTAGFAYPWNHALVHRYGPVDRPFLVHPPGTRWHYGINIDHVGRLIETASGQDLESYFQQHILQPLQMDDTSFLLPPEKLPRLAFHHQRDPDGVLRQLPRTQPPSPPFYNGGGGLFSTARDYLRFLQYFLGRGPRLLSDASLQAMVTNQTGSLPAGRISTTMPERSCDVDFHPGHNDRFTLGFLLNPEPYAQGRSANSLAWGGIRNTFYWIDPARGIAALVLMQFQPFCDPAAIDVLHAWERRVYQTL